jgi:hypothetical protein
MKELIFTKWTLSRLLRLIIGLAILVQAFISKDILFGVAGLLFTSMALFNVGCCGAGACYMPSKKKDENLKEVTYEEVV